MTPPEQVGQSLDASRASAQAETTAIRVVLFTDMKGSTAIKQEMAERWDENAFQRLRIQHDTALRDIITRDHAGEIIKSTGDGVMAVFQRPSEAVLRALEIQESFRGHPQIQVRIGIDVGEVRVESSQGRTLDVFGRHVDWAARAMSLADGGHICVTRQIYTDAFSWITKGRVAWKEHGLYRAKLSDPPLEIFEPYNANIGAPMEKLAGERIAPVPGGREPEKGPANRERVLRIVRSWEHVARDGRDFAENGAGAMYWFKVPLGGLAYPDGFRNFLLPALMNPRIHKIRFVLDSTAAAVRRTWYETVLPALQAWAAQEQREFVLEQPDDHAGKFYQIDGAKTLAWIFVDLSMEFTPCFKLLCPDLDTDHVTDSEAQVFLSTATRTIRAKDGALTTVRIPDAILRLKAGEEDSLLYALNTVANQRDSLFT